MKIIEVVAVVIKEESKLKATRTREIKSFKYGERKGKT